MSRKLPELPDRDPCLPAMARIDLRMAQRRLKSYPHWLEQLRDLDEWFSSITSPDLFGSTGVSGGESVAVQEKILMLKESHPGYEYFRKSVEKVQAIMGALSQEEREVVQLWHFEKVDEYDICGILEISRRTLFRRKKSAERKVSTFWAFEPEEIKSQKVRKMALAVSG